MATYYHVAGEQYQAGDDLLCWNTLVEQGILTDADWRWQDAEIGHDGNVVCLYQALAEAREHQAEYGGTVLAVEVEEDGEIRLTTVEEGFTAALYRIPAYAISEVA